MLESIEGRLVEHLPHDQQYQNRIGRLQPGLADEVLAMMSSFCADHASVTAGWLFRVSEFEAKHRDVVGALGSEEEANQLLGQMLWETLRQRPETWLFHRPERQGEFPAAMHYWRKPAMA